MKKALKIGIMGMIGFMLFVYGGLNGYCLAWRRLYDRGNYIGADGLSCIARHTFYGSRVDEEGMPCLVLDYNTPPKWLGY